MSNIPQRRRNPFAQQLNQAEEPKEQVEEKVVEEEKIEEEKPVPQKPQPKPKKVIEEDPEREKYTATMDITLRRKIKVYCAENGIMFSEFIEAACREKLRHEGVK